MIFLIIMPHIEVLVYPPYDEYFISIPSNKGRRRNRLLFVYFHYVVSLVNATKNLQRRTFRYTEETAVFSYRIFLP
jgi:hypothetical protein